ncbi:hypothetical protein Ancab_011397 [Ancistrocladus abbreviatus]
MAKLANWGLLDMGADIQIGSGKSALGSPLPRQLANGIRQGRGSLPYGSIIGLSTPYSRGQQAVFYFTAKSDNLYTWNRPFTVLISAI